MRIVSVVGLGYVGLPVAVAFSKVTKVIGFDLNKKRVKDLNSGFDVTGEVDDIILKQARLHFTSDPNELKQADFHIVAVPTPVGTAKQPDFTALFKASEIIGGALKPGSIVVYESTVFPGVTEEKCVPILEQFSGLKCGRDFKVGYSPERINPGDKEHTFGKIIKIVAGQDEESLNIIAETYGSVIEAGVHRASSIKVAEAAKIIENIQRDVNIALMNELAIIFNKLELDTAEILEAARTKWNFLPFTPGLVGGHCIGVDPYYMTHKAAEIDYTPQVILASRRINDSMGVYVAHQVIKGLIHAGLAVKGATVSVLGLTFKENVSDVRNSRVIDIIRELVNLGVHVQAADPIANPSEALELYGQRLQNIDELAPADAILLAVPHSKFLAAGWPLMQKLLKRSSGFVVDVKSRLPREEKPLNISLWRL